MTYWFATTLALGGLALLRGRRSVGSLILGAGGNRLLGAVLGGFFLVYGHVLRHDTLTRRLPHGDKRLSQEERRKPWIRANKERRLRNGSLFWGCCRGTA